MKLYNIIIDLVYILLHPKFIQKIKVINDIMCF